MRVILTLCLVVCVSVGVSSICSSICPTLCNKFLNIFPGNVPITSPDSPFNLQGVRCNTTCSIYCRCVESCLALREDCTDSGLHCVMKVFKCLVSEINTLPNIITSLGGSTLVKMAAGIAYVTDLYSQENISQYQLTGLFDKT